MAAVLTEFRGPEAAIEAHRFTNDELLRLLRSPRGKQMLDRLLDDLVTTRLLARPLGRPANILPRLEALLLSIMQDQFKYINLFGALLGFIIGLLNLLILRVF
ncbi:hypothetical protein [Desulfurivibrio sp. C05AmB]|uniref:hypothetical protein n=1 Tax=Desulfurivibrio sp. C05AmB TaxID=3374371 RepID=UPI00376F1367